MPRATKKDVVPPTLDEDALERKRVLNVLAQRRYRKRNKDRIQALLARAEGNESSDAIPPPNQAPCTLPTAHESLATHTISPREPFSVLRSEPTQSLPHGLSLLAWSFPWSPTGEWPEVNTPSFDFNEHEDLVANQSPDILDFPSNITAELQNYDTSAFSFPDDRILEVPSLTLLNAAMKIAQRLNITDLIWDMSAVSPFFQGDSSQTLMTDPPSLNSSSASVSGPSSTRSPSYMTVFDKLPSHLQPTPTQRLIPHHPVLDLLPWPSTRDKLIQVFNLPVNLRPQTARDPMGVVRLVYDMEDSSGEGLKVNGQDPFEPQEWEIGQLLFERWWWAFESIVVANSNCARRDRGKETLRLEC
ncbi:hypothetical protein N7471_009369 [Penicillium samsonianum]|uniref:uncharacterized protein n=1 Tax=Penicillium samsonianum TaxID=1882272 RepID=UPI00254673EE|nr:uncharacterized protein N7471_009369 [Penicillium samsonianum]KAJ6128152.1 hypothetical protein N7471_009369 [Penicillium samsonianum]